MAQYKHRVLRWDVSRARSRRSFVLIFLRHVAKTGDIKHFVITEESGIAKGIRRIVAVTGHEAAEATRLADALQAKLTREDRDRLGLYINTLVSYSWLTPDSRFAGTTLRSATSAGRDTTRTQTF